MRIPRVHGDAGQFEQWVAGPAEAAPLPSAATPAPAAARCRGRQWRRASPTGGAHGRFTPACWRISRRRHTGYAGTAQTCSCCSHRPPVAGWVVPEGKACPRTSFRTRRCRRISRTTMRCSRTATPRAAKRLSSRRVACIGCHRSPATDECRPGIGPNLTHIGRRHTIGGGISIRTTPQHLARWIKNAREDEARAHHAGARRRGRIDPKTKKPTMTGAASTEQQIADIVAYLQRPQVTDSDSERRRWQPPLRAPRLRRTSSSERRERHLELADDRRSQADRHALPLSPR